MREFEFFGGTFFRIGRNGKLITEMKLKRKKVLENRGAFIRISIDLIPGENATRYPNVFHRTFQDFHRVYTPFDTFHSRVKKFVRIKHRFHGLSNLWNMLIVP